MNAPNCYQVPVQEVTVGRDEAAPDFNWPNCLLNELDPNLQDGVPSFGQ